MRAPASRSIRGRRDPWVLVSNSTSSAAAMVR
jgi:hypothetical protein